MRDFPRARAKQNRTASWHIKAFVEATPISGPAKVGRVISASRCMELSGALTIASVLTFLALQAFKAASVSAVSPD